MAVLRFAVFELDEATLELRKAGRRVHLAAQPVRILMFLARRAGTVVTREELRQHVWGDDTFVVFDQALSFSLGRVRKALGDSARSPRFVETLPKVGYRFLAPVDIVEPDVPRTAAAAIALPPAARRPVRAPVLLLLIALGTQGAMPVVPHTRDSASPRAQAAFARARAEASKGSSGRRRSVPEFREALREDPRFAEAHHELAGIYLSLSETGELQPAVALPEAEREASAALALEDRPETRVVLASARWFGRWDWDGARRDLERAIERAPNSDAALMTWARFLSATGDDLGALRTIDRAETNSPSCPALAAESGDVRFRARRFEEAVLKYRQAIALGPPAGEDALQWEQGITMQILRVHVRMQAWPDAQRDGAELLRLVGQPVEGQQAFLAQPPREAVFRFLAGSARFLEQRFQQQYLPRVEIARVHALRGDADAAMRFLSRAADEREPLLARSLRDPDFDALRGDPRFVALAARIGPPPAAVRVATR